MDVMANDQAIRSAQNSAFSVSPPDPWSLLRDKWPGTNIIAAEPRYEELRRRLEVPLVGGAYQMSVTHYSCLELLAQRPGLSNSELARGAFVTRQSMNVLLQALEREGYVTRPAEAPVGKVLPTRLTPRGRRSLEKATVAVRSVEVRMLAGLSETEQSGAFRMLQSMVNSLRGAI